MFAAILHQPREREARCRRAGFSARRYSVPVYESSFLESRAGKCDAPLSLSCRDRRRQKRIPGHRIPLRSAASRELPLRATAGYKHQFLNQSQKPRDINGTGGSFDGTTRRCVATLRAMKSLAQRREFPSCAFYRELDAERLHSCYHKRTVV